MRLGPYELGSNDTPENGIYTAETARQRVRETQPPLFAPETQQAEMEL